MTTTFKIRTIPYLLMSESSKSEFRLSTKIEEPFADITGDSTKSTTKAKNLGDFFSLPSDHTLKSVKGASESFSDYMKDNGKAHPQMTVAAHNVDNANKYLTSKAVDNDCFNNTMYKQTILSVKNAFNALQKVGQQHNHQYLGDMIDQAKDKYHSYMKANHPDTFSTEPNQFKIFKSADKNNLMAGFKDDTKHLTEADRSEYSANNLMANSASPKTGTDSHHVYVKRAGGKMKSIAGPFSTAEQAEAHPARKWGDGVAKGSLMENVSDDMDVLSETRLFTTSKAYFNKKAGRYVTRKVPASGGKLETEDGDK